MCSVLPPPQAPANSVVETLITNLKGLGRSGLREVIRSIEWAPQWDSCPDEKDRTHRIFLSPHTKEDPAGT